MLNSRIMHRLRDIDLDRVFQSALQRGYTSCELYSEFCYQSRMTVQDRIEDIRLFTTGGVSLRVNDGQSFLLFSTNAPTTETFLRFLGERVASQPTRQPAKREPALDLPSSSEKFAQLGQLSRQLWNEGGYVGIPQFLFEDKVKYFEVADHRGTYANGTEQSAGISLQWIVERHHSRVLCRADKHRGSIQALLQDLSLDSFRDRIKATTQPKAAWPAPKGEIPILWSSMAFSKLGLLFLRAFEGDLFLGNSSFLTRLSPLPLQFTVEDIPESDVARCDHEGSLRRPVMLLQEGKPRGLACNNRIAEQLAVSSTGHCRRESFQSHPTVGFWNPRIQGNRKVDGLLKQMEWGISVHDVEIAHFSPQTGEITLRIAEGYLVHHGEEGEAIEPLTLTTNLVELLSTISEFSEKCDTSGYPICKQGQQFITEITAPSAFSAALNVPGFVPTSHYW